MNIFAHITIMCIMMIFFLIVLRKLLKNIKVSNDLYLFLNKNMEFLSDIHKKQFKVELKNSIKVYSKFQIIQKISNADFVSAFKYDYSKRYLELDFLFSVDNNGNIIQNSVLDKLPVTGNLLTMDILTSADCKLCSFSIDDIEERNDDIYRVMKYYDLNKFHYQHIFKDKDTPTWFIVISYKDEKYLLSEDDKEEIIRILNNIENIKNVDVDIEFLKDKKDNSDNKKGIINKTKKWLHNVFITGIVLLLFGVIFINHSYINSDQTFSNYFKPYEIGNIRGPYEKSIEIGLLEFKNAEYSKALEEFEKNINAKKSNDFILFYAGCSALFNNEPDKALKFFNNCDTNSPFSESAEWYTAGCYLKKNDPVKANEYLTKIANNPEHFYHQKALEILKKNILKN